MFGWEQMALSVAAPKSNELLAHLQALGHSTVLDEVALRRVAAEARRLMGTDAAAAHVVLGTVEALVGDPVATREHYRVALGLSSEAPIWFNYWTSLAFLDEHAASLDIAREGLKIHQGDLALTELAVDAAVRSGQFDTAAELCQHRARLGADGSYPRGDMVQSLTAAVATGAMSEAGAQRLIDVLTEIQRAKDVRTVSTHLLSDGETFLYQRHVRCTPAKASSMNWQLAEAAVERRDLSSDPGRVLMGGFVGVANGRNA